MRGRVKGYIADMKTAVIVISDGSLKEGDQVDVGIHREKRSLNANSYFHVMCTSLAEKLGNSNAFQKNLLLRRYGQYEYIDGKIPTYLIKSQYDAQTDQREDIHFNPIGYEIVGEDVYTKYCVMRGSHTYDTKEMSRLIDGTVNECKEVGIETMTPDELERMKALWKAY